MARQSSGRNVCSVCRTTYTSPSHFTTKTHRAALARADTKRAGNALGRNTGTRRARRNEAWRLARGAYVRVRRHVRGKPAMVFTELHRLSDGVYRVAFAALPDQLGYLTVGGPARWMRKAARSLQATV